MLLNIFADISKGEVQDLEKAKHYIYMIIDRDYDGEHKPLPYGFTFTEKK